ncbi:dTMP kinase [Streptomyces xiaopingdaonensis]|uniref:dTMP kinase n=1 Tax=Streptomyces xiaopingdaonensis TaxID=1565415 RepID=UPI0003810332|nr:dTMP kinase [Streptomyces xiaopingdaonensis]
MTRAEQPTGANPTPDDALAAESRDGAVGALLRFPPLRRLWSAQFAGGIGDVLGLLVLVLLAVQAATVHAISGDPIFGGGYRDIALVVAVVLGVRLLAVLLFGAVLLGPVSALVNQEKKILDRRWTLFGTLAFRAVALIVAPLWIDWTPGSAFALILVTVFTTGVAERLATVTRDAVAPALLPEPPPGLAGAEREFNGIVLRPVPDHREALGRLWLRTGFGALPLAATALVVATLVGNLLGTGVAWFADHQAALASYVAAGLLAAGASLTYFLALPDTPTSRPRSPLEGLRRPRSAEGTEKGRTGAVGLLVLAGSAVGGALAGAVGLAVLEAFDLGGGPVAFGLLVLGLTAGSVAGVRLAPRTLPALSRRRLLPLSLALTGVALLCMGLVPDTATVLVLSVLAGATAGVAANTAHALLDQETEESRRARTTAHLQAVVRLTVAICAVVAPVLAAFIGRHRVESGDFVFAHGGASFTLMLVGALLLPVAALVLGRLDDRQGVPLRRDLADAFGADTSGRAPAEHGFFLVLEGGDGAGKSTQVEALAEWLKGKGHEVVVTREPGATPIGKRLRSILLDVSSAGVSHRTEALLYAADRAEHVDTVVRPALERGAVVLSDRYIDSSVAYQGAGRDLAPSDVARISRWATDGLVPHLTVLLDVVPQTARERFTEAPDRLESEPPEFHERVRAGFLTLAAADPARYLVVDAAQAPETVTTAIQHRVDQVLPLSEAEKQAQEEARKAAEEEARRKAEEERRRKEEEERLERERQEQLEKLRAEEEERKRREAEFQKQQEEARQAEEARRRAEEERRRQEEEERRERERREAEERAYHEEQERLRRRKAEEERLRAEAEERRQERQRKAEEALLRTERAREAEQQREAPPAAPDGTEADTAKLPQVPGSGTGRRHSLSKEPKAEWPSSEETRPLPQAEWPGEETTVLPQVPEEETPRPEGSEADTAEWQFRREGFAAAELEERTRELPQVDPEAQKPRRPRPEWAEETPLDDVPSLADELLGPHGDDWQRPEDEQPRQEDDEDGRREH